MVSPKSLPWVRGLLVGWLGLLAALLSGGVCFATEEPRDVAQETAADTALPALPSDFQEIDRGWLRVEFPASVREHVEASLVDAEAFRARLSADLGQPVLDHVIIRVARGPDQMADLAPLGSPPPPYASGVAYPPAHLILLSLKAPGTWEATDLAEVLRHELTHVALHDALAGHPMPLWFNEGFAIRESGELRWQRTRTLWSGELANQLLTLGEINRAFPSDSSGVSLAYAESADVVHFLMRDADRARFGSLVERIRGGMTFESALQDAYGIDLRKLEYEWREDMRHQVRLLPMLTEGWPLWGFGALLLGAAWIVKRRRAAAKLAEWAREEASSLSASRRLQTVEPAKPAPASDVAPPRVPSVPVVEHEGRWHTLH